MDNAYKIHRHQTNQLRKDRKRPSHNAYKAWVAQDIYYAYLHIFVSHGYMYLQEFGHDLIVVGPASRSLD